jgi:glycosyltransferase involved in cell wall biosynthesis
MEFKILSIVTPVYNEEHSILPLLQRVKNVDLMAGIQKEFIIVNDFSSDLSEQKIHQFITENPLLRVKYVKHPHNKGKGAAIRTAIQEATGDLLIIQDADNEYDPEEYNRLLKPILGGYADVVYGSRFIGGNPHRILFYWHSIGNKFLTKLLNASVNLNLTDMESCYKLFKTDIIKNVNLVENRFGFEPEVTAKIARDPNVRIYEVGISYYGRTYQEGKKINWKDGFRAIYCIAKYGLLRSK